MAQAAWEMTAAVAVACHNNGMNAPIRDPNTINPYGRGPLANQIPRENATVKMTLEELLPTLNKAWS